MGQAVYRPVRTTVFFSYNATLQGESGEEIMARLKRDLLPTQEKKKQATYQNQGTTTFQFERLRQVSLGSLLKK